MNKKRKKKSPFCGCREFTSTGKTRTIQGVAGMNFVPITIHDKQYKCNKCKYKSWADEDMNDGRHFCTQR